MDLDVIPLNVIHGPVEVGIVDPESEVHVRHAAGLRAHRAVGPPVINIGISTESVESEKCYWITVEDNGPGVPDEMKTLIFNRQLRGGGRAKGSGMGLYLVKALADDFHGRVWVEDRVPGDRGQGSRFVVLLPALEK